MGWPQASSALEAAHLGRPGALERVTREEAVCHLTVLLADSPGRTHCFELLKFQLSMLNWFLGQPNTSQLAPKTTTYDETDEADAHCSVWVQDCQVQR